MKKSLILLCMCAVICALTVNASNTFADRKWRPFKKAEPGTSQKTEIETPQKKETEPEVKKEEVAPTPVPEPAKETPSPEPVTPAPQNLEIQDLTIEEIAARLGEIFQYHPNIPAGIQGLETKKGEDGTISYEFNGVPLTGLDKLTLSNLLRNANNQLSLENMDRTQRQLQALKRLNDVDRAAKTQQQLRNLQRINDLTRTQKILRQPPRTYSPPKIPKPYTPSRRY